MDLVRIQPKDQIQPIDLVAPGFRGLNTVQSGSILPSAYCAEALNCVLDSSGRLSARQGIVTQSSTPITGAPQILTSFEYNGGATIGKQQIVAWNGGISNNVVNPNTGSLAGTGSYASGVWKFSNFNNKCVGFQNGQKPIVYAGSGTFNLVVESSGTAPTGGVGTSAFGRVWCVDADLQTLKYSGLLNETDWGSVSAGTIDMRTIWSAGTDTVTAIVAFNSSLVVFGTEHIVFFTDGRGSMLGLDPTQAYVFDIIASTGCFSQFTVQPIGEGDMMFLGPNGIQSIGNLQTERSYPQSNVSKYCRDAILNNVASETPNSIRSTYNDLLGQYYLSCPNTGVIWVADVRRQYQDDQGDSCAIMTRWSMKATAAHTTVGNISYFARTPGTIGIYSGNTDEGTQYQFTYLSPWLDLGQDLSQRLKMLKRFELICFSGGNTAIVFNWNVDFGNMAQSGSIALPPSGAPSQYGLGQYGISQYAGGANISLLKYPARARGQYYQVGISSLVASLFSLQQIQLACKIGRIA